MTKFGRVTAFDASSGMATIVYERPQACEKCGACSGRGYTGTLVIQAHCAVGDWVRVELPDGRFLGASALAYVLPLCGLLARAVVVIDPEGRVVYSELVPEITEEPDYERAVEAVKGC